MTETLSKISLKYCVYHHPHPLLQVITDLGNYFHLPDLLQATTYLVAAERALRPASN